jgi:hypothetical protein
LTPPAEARIASVPAGAGAGAQATSSSVAMPRALSTTPSASAA